MSVFPEWPKFAVPQRRPKTGCIPTGFEFLARAAQISDINFETFQDDFDLDQDKDFEAGDEPENHFGSVARAVQEKYPDLIYESVSFDSGAQKVKFIEDQLEAHHPVLVSLAMTPLNGQGWHIMPVVDSDGQKFTLLLVVTTDRKENIVKLDKQLIAHIHDNYPGGDEVAFLNPASSNKP